MLESTPNKVSSGTGEGVFPSSSPTPAGKTVAMPGELSVGPVSVTNAFAVAVRVSFELRASPGQAPSTKGYSQQKIPR